LRPEFLHLCRPAISEEEIAAVADVLRSGWITSGPQTVALEERVAEYVGAAGAVALTSATAGMHLALKALDLGPGDEVITPSMTWVSTANLIVLAGATPVFADIDRDTLMVTRAGLERCLSDKTRAIIPVHFAGAAVEMGPIRALARERGVAVIEDGAHAIGTRTRGGLVGGEGTVIFSFHPIKTMTTGEGGMVCSDDQAFLERLRRLRFHGLGLDAWTRTSQGRAPQAEVLEPGYKYNMTDVAAALGLGQLARVEEFIGKRTVLAEAYREAFAGMEEIQPLADGPETSRHSWSLFVVRLHSRRGSAARDGLMARLKERNIGTGLHFRAIHLHPFYRENPSLWRGELPDTEWNSERILSLPLFPEMTLADVNLVVTEIREALAA